MDFSWAINALKEGKKVTRRSLAGDPPIYLYWNKADNTIMRDYGARTASKWHPSLDNLFAEDWEEYVEPADKLHQEDSPVWSEVNMTAEEHQRMHSGKKHTFKDLCDDYLEQQKGKVQINPLPFTTTLEMHDGEVCESWPAVTKVWTTYWDLDIQITGSLIDKADYPYTLCERDVIEQKRDKLVVLAEPGFSQRTVTLHLNENCWMDAKDASASLIHRVTNRFGWNTEFLISLLNGIEHTDGDWCKPCREGDNRSLGDLFTEDMEFLSQEQARVTHSFYYIINQYLRLVQTTAPERQRMDILARCEESVRQHHIVLDELSKKDANHV